MNTLVIVLIAAVCLFGAYMLYGRWLANKWGIDPTAKTPAVVHEDGRDYVPTDGWTVFAHQFSSIAGAGPVTGAIQAAAFGWLPVLLWVLLGGIFFGAVTDFGALYASVKNDGKSMGMLIEKYIGKTGRKLFLLFCWLFCGIVIAAFADMVAGTFNAFGADGAMVEAAKTNGAAGRSALKEVSTKVEILNDEFQQVHQYNPIEYIKSRIKSPESIVKKLKRYGYESSIDNMVDYINDIAGIRIVCSFTSDIYKLAEMIGKQNDLTVVSVKDYIKHPKESGYISR